MFPGPRDDAVEHQHLFLGPHCAMAERQSVLVEFAALGFGVEAVVSLVLREAALGEAGEEEIRYVEVADLLSRKDADAAIFFDGGREFLLMKEVGEDREEFGEGELTGLIGSQT